mgnify:CR=1 FL=1
MVLKNLTRGTILAKDLQCLESFWEKSWGLLNKNNSCSLYFQTRFGIHTFGLKKPIDVLILNNDFIVVALATITPNRIFFWNPKYSKIIELPFGSIKKSKTKLGNDINLFAD